MAKAATKAERAHMEKVKSMPCVVCHESKYDWCISDDMTFSPYFISEFDHLVDGNRLGHLFGIPLCSAHHIGKKGHAGGKLWDSSKPNQWRLMEKVYKVLGKEMPAYNPKGRNNFQV